MPRLLAARRPRPHAEDQRPYRRALDAYKRGSTTREKLDALSRIDTVLGEARGKLDEAPLHRFARAADWEIRRHAASLLGQLPWSRAGAVLTTLVLSDVHPFVRSSAVDAMLRSAGPLRAARVLGDAAERENEIFVDLLGDEIASEKVANALASIVARYPDRLADKGVRAARKLLEDDEIEPPVKVLLEALSSSFKRS